MAASEYKVLVGDDDPALLRLLSHWLQQAGYPTRTALDGQEAIEAIEEDCPDLVITDWEMPRINGLELCRRVREMKLPHYVYILFLTAKTAHTEIIAGLDIGADDFLCKPVLKEELFARMRSGVRVLELERRLSLMASTDSLTGLITQRVFYEALEKEWHRSERFHLPLSCVMVDLDYFKQINDVHGHPAGDSVLKFAAELLLDNCRQSDTVCRYGGEEFCAMLPETEENEAAVWAERARRRLAALRYPMRRKSLRVTGSFGVAQRTDDTPHSEKLVDRADQALLYAKRAGRDRVVCYAAMLDAAGAKLHSGERHGGVFRDVRACDVMTPLAVCLREDQTIDEAAELFLQAGMASTPVLDAQGALAGFLSKKDLLAVMVSPDCWQRAIDTVMRRNVVSYEEDTPIRVIYEFLCRVSIHGVVITRNGRPIGVINQSSLLNWFRKGATGTGVWQEPPTILRVPSPAL